MVGLSPERTPFRAGGGDFLGCGDPADGQAPVSSFRSSDRAYRARHPQARPHSPGKSAAENASETSAPQLAAGPQAYKSGSRRSLAPAGRRAKATPRCTACRRRSCIVPSSRSSRSQPNLVVTHSITLSAPARSVGGIMRPSARAVLRLTMSSNLVGCSTGSSAGLAPFKIFSTKPAIRRHDSSRFGP
jgi:hypothetical protein